MSWNNAYAANQARNMNPDEPVIFVKPFWTAHMVEKGLAGASEPPGPTDSIPLTSSSLQMIPSMESAPAYGTNGQAPPWFSCVRSKLWTPALT